MTLTQWICTVVIFLGLLLFVISGFKRFPIGPPIIIRRKEREYSREELKQATLRAMRVGATKVANERAETTEQIHTEWFENQFPTD